ncbi:MAG TPA: TRAP transporter TatT component family protein [Bacteroidota bacterium]|jgi:tetratricopeptide (TPR) repeat protein|nr:TRAP transporter TatT component family protein [Bacteroidota bacterium]
MKQKIFIAVASALFLQGCIQTIAIRSMGGIFNNGIQSYMEESDLQLAHESLGSTLKLLETMIKTDPKNTELLVYAAQGYQAYGLAFCEDDNVERARTFYLRGKEYGMRVLLNNKQFRQALDGDLETFHAALTTFSKKDVPALFWTAFNWGSYINITRTDVAALADISKVMEMIQRVIELDSTYYYGAAYVFLGTLEAATPKMLGGQPEKSKEYFEKALSINGRKFLLTQVYFAKSYGVQMQDQELFDSLLTEVENASIDIVPECRLPNAIAKQKAQLLRAQENDLF